MIAGRHKSGKYVGWVIRTILSYSLRVRAWFRRLRGLSLEFIMELSPWPGGFLNSGHNSPLEGTILKYLSIFFLETVVEGSFHRYHSPYDWLSTRFKLLNTFLISERISDFLS